MSDDIYSGELHAWIEPEIEARVVALVLGEASDFEAEEIGRLMEERPEIRVFKRRIETLHGLLDTTLAPKDNDEWALAPAKRAELLEALALAPAAAEEVTAIEPAAAGAAKERRIRRAGRRVLWGAAACFAITVIVAGIVGVRQIGGNVKEGRAVRDRAAGSEATRAKNLGDGGAADLYGYSLEAAPPEMANEPSDAAVALTEEAARGGEPGNRPAGTGLERMGRFFDESKAHQARVDMEFGNHHKWEGREAEHGGVETVRPAVEAGSSGGVGGAAESPPASRPGRPEVGDRPVAGVEIGREFSYPTEYEPPEIDSPAPGMPATPGWDDKSRVVDGMSRGLARDDAQALTRNPSAMAEGESVPAAETATEGPAGPSQQAGQRPEGNRRGVEGRGEDLAKDGATRREVPARPGEWDDDSRQWAEGKETEELVDRGRALAETRALGSTAGGREVEPAATPAPEPEPAPMTDPGSPPPPGEPVAGNAVEERLVEDYLVSGNEGGRDALATLSVEPDQAPGGMLREEEWRRRGWGFDRERAESKEAAAGDQTSTEVGDTYWTTAWSTRFGRPSREASPTEKDRATTDYFGLPASGPARTATGQSGTSNLLALRDQDSDENVASSKGAIITGAVQNPEFGVPDTTTKLHFFNSNLHGVQSNHQAAGGLERDLSNSVGYRPTERFDTGGAGSGGGVPLLGDELLEEGQEPLYVGGFVQQATEGPFFPNVRAGMNLTMRLGSERKDFRKQELDYDFGLAARLEQQLAEVEAKFAPAPDDPQRGNPSLSYDFPVTNLGEKLDFQPDESAKPEIRQLDGFVDYGETIGKRLEQVDGEMAVPPGADESGAKLEQLAEPTEADRVYELANMPPTSLLPVLPAGEGEAAEVVRPEFEVRTWEIPVAAWGKVQSGEVREGAALNARALVTGEEEVQLGVDPKEALAKYGVTFSEGTAADYEMSTGKMIVRNTAENLARIEEVVQESLQQVAREQEAKEQFEQDAAAEPTSTFSLHVSDVSFKLAKAALDRGEWPAGDQIRVEEFVNAFDYGDPTPTQEEKVACAIEQAAHPFLQQRNVLRISMRTAALGRAAGTPLRLTVLLDKSGSMDRLDRAESVRNAFHLLAAELAPQDQVTLLSFARTTRLLADRVSGEEADRLAELVAATPSEGGTNMEEALRVGIAKAREQFVEGGQNRIILLTDGAANLGNAKPADLAKLIEEMRQQGIAFDACGVGAEGLNDEILESLTRKGDGRYYFLDRPEDADDGFAKQIAGALRPAARNVKVQVNFNPERVGRYRLYGFEKHLLKKEDFRNDSVDAAELAAEEAGNAIYHVEVRPEGRGEIGTVAVRFQDMASGLMVEKQWTIPYDPNTDRLEGAKPSMRLAAGAALLGERVKGGAIGEVVDLARLGPLLNTLPADFPSDPRVRELAAMAAKMRELAGE